MSPPYMTGGRLFVISMRKSQAVYASTGQGLQTEQGEYPFFFAVSSEMACLESFR